MTTTIITKNSSTASGVPLAADLTAGELAINLTDKRLFSKNGSTVFEAGTNPSALTLPNGTANGVAYLNGSKVLTTGTALTFDGTNKFSILSSAASDGFSISNGGATPATLSIYTGALSYGVSIGNGISGGGESLRFDPTAHAQIFNVSSSEQMRLTSTGLGIGTSSPTQKLHLSVGTATAIYTRIANSAGDCFLGVDSSGNTNLSADNAGNQLIFKTVATERARIDSSGNLLVGTTSASANVTASDNTAGNAYYIAAGIGSTVGLASTAKNDYSLQLNRQGNTDGVIAGFRRNGILVGNISVTGSTTAYNTSSDYRLKNITGPVTGAEAKAFIMALQPEQGSWKADGSKFVGFVADKFQEVSPSSVTGTKDAVDAEGNPVMQAMQASSPEVMANLVAHIQYLEQRLAALESK